jgi:hypothetical protein
VTEPGLPEARPGTAGDWRDYPRALRQFIRLHRHHRDVQREMRRPHRFRDPVTGDELTLGEEVSWVLQGVIRRWTVFAAITVFTLFAWIHGQIWAQGWTSIWNLFASYWAMALETVVGIAMFSQTRRDAVKIRKIERVQDTIYESLAYEEAILRLVCGHLGLPLPDRDTVVSAAQDPDSTH